MALTRSEDGAYDEIDQVDLTEDFQGANKRRFAEETLTLGSSFGSAALVCMDSEKYLLVLRLLLGGPSRNDLQSRLREHKRCV